MTYTEIGFTLKSGVTKSPRITLHGNLNTSVLNMLHSFQGCQMKGKGSIIRINGGKFSIAP